METIREDIGLLLGIGFCSFVGITMLGIIIYECLKFWHGIWNILI